MTKTNIPWSFWYHSSSEHDWSRKSYVSLYKTQIAEEFWGVFKLLTSKHFDRGIVFVMRDDVFPDWSSPENIKGGFLSYKINSGGKKQQFLEVVKLWLERLVSNTLSLNAGVIPNGISISPKSGHFILKVWFPEQLKSINVIPRDLPMSNTGKFTSFCQKGKSN